GELEILRGNGRRARHEYRKAVGLTDCTLFMIQTMQMQLTLYNLLGVRQELLAPVLEELACEIAHRQLKHYDKDIVFNGHRTEDPGRPLRRLPDSRTAAAAAAIREKLKVWGITPGMAVLAICGGARGGDILFAEECRDVGADVRLLLP